MGPESRDATLFVADEVIIDGDDRELAKNFVRATVRRRCPRPRCRLRRPPFIANGALTPTPCRSPCECGSRSRRTSTMQWTCWNGPPAECDPRQRTHVVTSPMALAVAAIAVRHAMEGRPIGLNQFGRTLAMPLSSARDGAVPIVGNNPFTWPAFAGRTVWSRRGSLSTHPSGSRQPLHVGRSPGQRLLAR